MRHKEKSLILASKSAIRVKIMALSQLPFFALASDVNEETFKKNNKNGKELSLILSKEKAKSISLQYPESVVIGSDQVLTCEGLIYSKPRDKKDAVEQLISLQGKTHILHSSIVVMSGEDVLYHCYDEAKMTMRSLTTTYIEYYVDLMEDEILHCVGCYAYEGYGMRLFKEVQGDYYTILGFPVRDLIYLLETQGYVL